MYECPNCAGNLKFDVLAQKMYCSYCGTLSDPYDISKDHDAEEQVDEYAVTVFTCPQCGGEILSEDNTAATFCSFCGSSTILDSRISKEKRPTHIIPFKKTKEDCKKSYQKFMKRAIYAPKELKDSENIKRFRGIYMPYGVYSFEKEDEISFTGNTSKRRGDYIEKKSYEFHCFLQEKYDGLCYDLSSSFADNLSKSIAPYDMADAKKFTPSFLSGFYADTSDVEQEVYDLEAEGVVVDDVVRKIERDPGYKPYTLNLDTVVDATRPSRMTVEKALLPVWFLAYRNGDSVLYAAVNGQTGKVAADIPIDIKKFLLFSLLTSAVIFLFLNFFFTFRPNILLGLTILLEILCETILVVQLSNLSKKKSGEDDKGVMSQERDLDEVREKDERALKRFRISGANVWITTVVIIGVLMILSHIWIVVVFFIIQRLLTHHGRQFLRSLREKLREIGRFSLKGSLKIEGKKILIKPMIGVSFALIVMILHPVSDILYYVASLFNAAMMLWSMKDILLNYNVLTTRKLPQFNKRGGDQYA